jgi:hypothetical protein
MLKIFNEQKQLSVRTWSSHPCLWFLLVVAFVPPHAPLGGG